MRRNGGVELSRRFVLVVDDEEPVRQLVAEVLLEAGYRVEAVSCVADARPYLGDPTLDVIVSDVKMPDESGLVLVHEAAEARPGLPVVLMTGAAGAEERAEAERRGIPVLDKPFSFAQIEAAVAAALERSV